VARFTNKYSVIRTKNTLYTKGGEFTLEQTGEAYAGQYFLVDGVAYTGKPGEEGARRLLPYKYDNQDMFLYDRAFAFKNPVKLAQQPKYFRPEPVESDYVLGYIYRYVVTHNLIPNKFPIEIAVSQANTFGKLTGIDAGIYTLHKIKWTIAGPFDDTITITGIRIPSVETANREAVGALLTQYPVLEYYFRNYTEFARTVNF
jgi:hypothetical protein